VKAIVIPSIHRVSSPDFINQTITWPVSALNQCFLLYDRVMAQTWDVRITSDGSMDRKKTYFTLLK